MNVPSVRVNPRKYDKTDLLRAPSFASGTEWTSTRLSHVHFSAMRLLLVRRALSTRASAVYSNPAHAHDPALTSTPSGLTHRQRAVLDSALRVDHAGEIAANYIYKGQMTVLGWDPTVGPLIQVRVAHHFAVILDDRPLCRRCGSRKYDTSSSWTNFKYNIKCGPQYSLT